MIIAIDYDDTYTAAPSLFNKIIELFQQDGHTVICVTGRSENTTMSYSVRDSIGKLVPIIFAASGWKRDVALKQGYKVDIWIDDMPEMIGKQNILGLK